MSLLIQERALSAVADAITVGIRRGHAMLEWWNSFPRVALMDLPGCRPDSHMQYFISSMPIDGVPTSVMGCFQTSTFARNAAPGRPSVRLAEWVGEHWLRRTHWTNGDGSRGGFLYRPALVVDREGAGAVRRVDSELDLKLSEIGTRYAWAVVRLDLLDYMRAFPGIGRYNQLLQPLNREAGYLVLHPDFFRSPYPQPAGCVESYCFAYSVAPWKVLPSMMAYGPGRFYAAFKQFRFCLLEDGTVRVDVLFLVAPRCERMLNILGIDPVFGSARLLDALTRRRTRLVENLCTRVNHYAMGHHARVHDHLLCSMRQVWEETNWQPAVRVLDSSSVSGRQVSG